MSRKVAAPAVLSAALATLLMMPATPAVAAGHIVPGPGSGPVPAIAAGGGERPVSGPSPTKRNSTWTRSAMLRARSLDNGAAPEGDGGKVAGRAASARNAASPVSAETVPDPSAPPFNSNGRLFFRIGPEDQPDGNAFSCSGTVVSSRGRNVVFTAGHCVVDPPSTDNPSPTWAYDIVFVPGYRAGEAPFGQFATRDMITTKGQRDRGDRRYDIAAVSLKPGSSGPVEKVVSSRKIEFGADLAGRSVELFGYPTEPGPQFDGEQLVRCVPSALGFDAVPDPAPHMAWPCDMTHGASGGGWILDNRYLASVVSYGYEDNPSQIGRLYGPQFGSAALNVYTAKSIGGSVNPTVKLVKRPPLKVRKRAVNFRVAGDGSTPILFKARLDRNKPVYTGTRIKVRRLSVGKHVLRIRSIDQTGRLSPRTVTRKIRVLPKKKRRSGRR